MRVYLATVALLHVFFMLGELLPWPIPFVVRKTNEKLAPTDKLNPGQSKVVANIIRNAGIYNGIVAGGLFYAAFMGDSARDVALVFALGVSAAGIFGTITLRSWLCALQGILGLVGCYLLRLGI
jgi:putative membrane protein